ncbi:hypothetical protein Vadar_000817 [Vaccinium darrowii]|uniref:Uncharacterized protein n=1 Tax=Vaccinium darrowii TaxID=229202 RepID=A0ACB7X6P1_9ERIC|nr:hypothetical protein Vadar_000817 [Vaccinium darrowii]
MERRFGNQSLFTNPSSENFYPTARITPAGDQTLESSLSRLTLNSPSPPFDSNERYSPLPFQTNGLRVQNAVNGRMGFGFGGTGVNPTVELWGTAYNGVDYSFGFNQGLGLLSESGSGSHLNSPYSLDFSDSARLSSINQNLGGSFLQPKKQLGNQYNSQIPNLPFVKKNNFLDFSGPSGQNFDGFVRMKSYNLGTSSLNQFPQFMNGCSLEKLRGQIVRMAKDQYGSRFLQTKFEDPKEDEIRMVLSEVIDHLGELMGDQFGNYIVQKLVKLCNEKQRTLMFWAITKTPFQLISICLDRHGTRLVQRLLENITSQQQISLVMPALSPGAVVLATDPNGHFVIQHCLIHFSNEDNKTAAELERRRGNFTKLLDFVFFGRVGLLLPSSIVVEESKHRQKETAVSLGESPHQISRGLTSVSEKHGIEKQPFRLPHLIAATSIEKIRCELTLARSLGPGGKRSGSSTQVLRTSRRIQEEGGSHNGSTSAMPTEPIANEPTANDAEGMPLMVAQPSQLPTSPTDETNQLSSPCNVVGGMGSTSIPSRKRGRGPTRGVNVDKLRKKLGQPIPVEIDREVMAIVGDHATAVANAIGESIRAHAPVRESGWGAIEFGIRESIVLRVGQTFGLGDYKNDMVLRRIVDTKCQALYADWKARLYKRYKKLKKKHEKKGGPHPKTRPLYPCNPEDWVFMIDNVWETRAWGTKSKRGKKARKGLKYNHTSGSKSFVARASMHVRDKNKSKQSFLEWFKETHIRHRQGDEVWINDKAKKHHVQEQVSVEVLGKRSGYLKGYGIRKSRYGTQSQGVPNSEVVALKQQLADQGKVVADQGQLIADYGKKIEKMMLMLSSGVDPTAIPGLIQG